MRMRAVSARASAGVLEGPWRTPKLRHACRICIDAAGSDLAFVQCRFCGQPHGSRNCGFLLGTGRTNYSLRGAPHMCIFSHGP
eukprot:6147472-Pyramimonas_sp.AAC.1